MTGNKRASLNTQKTCMAEDVCVSKSCGHAYDRTATNIPFTIGYEKKMNSGSTSFDFKVRDNVATAAARPTICTLQDCGLARLCCSAYGKERSASDPIVAQDVQWKEDPTDLISLGTVLLRAAVAADNLLGSCGGPRGC